MKGPDCGWLTWWSDHGHDAPNSNRERTADVDRFWRERKIRNKVRMCSLKKKMLTLDVSKAVLKMTEELS